MYRSFPVLGIALSLAILASGCSSNTAKSPTAETPIDSSTSWQEKSKLAVAKAKENNSNESLRLILSALEQVAGTKGLSPTPDLENLLTCDLPDVIRPYKYSSEEKALLEKIYQKQVEICQNVYGKNSVQTADSMMELYLFYAVSDRKQSETVSAELREIDAILKDKGTPADASEWKKRKEAHAEKVTGKKVEHPKYAIATVDIPAGELIDIKTLKEVSAPYSQHPSGALAGGNLMIGCRTINKINKGSAITTHDICKHSGGYQWGTILETDPGWVQASKKASQAYQQKDYDAALKHFDALATELTKLAEQHKQLNDYCENGYLMPLATYSYTVARGGSGKLSAVDRDRSIAFHKTVIAALSKMAPPNFETLVDERENLYELTNPEAEKEPDSE